MSNARTNVEKLRDIVSVRDFGAKGDGIADDTAAIQAAIDFVNAAYVATGRGGMLSFPRGRYVCQTITWKSGCHGKGEPGLASSELFLKNNTNADLVKGENADTLFGGTTDGGLEDYSFTDMAFHGNRANNTSGSCVKIYGRRPVITNCFFRDAAHHGLWHKWGTVITRFAYGGEGLVHGCIMYNTGRVGLYWQGPHDVDLSHTNVIDASQEGDNVYDAIVIEKNARLSNVHSWRHDPGSFSTKVARTACRINITGCDVTNCHFEGGYTASLELTSAAQFTTLAGNNKYYAAHNGVTVKLDASSCTLEGNLLGPATATPAKGVVLGSSAAYNLIRLNAIEQQAGIIDWTGSGGYNHVVVRGVNTGGTFMVGSPAATDSCDVVVGGPGGGTLYRHPGGLHMPQASVTAAPVRFTTTSGISAAGTTHIDATGLDTGIVVHNVTVVASGAGVRLPVALRGAMLVVNNQGANTLTIYPASAENIGTAADNVGVSLATNKGAMFICTVDGFWIQVTSA